MEFFRISLVNGGVYVRMLVYNDTVWYHWTYEYVKKESYTTDRVSQATNFGTVEEATKWIDDHIPR